jgi:hypothetical protein
VPGWNPLSFRLHPTSAAILDALASLEGSFYPVYAWDASGGHVNVGGWNPVDYPSGEICAMPEALA